MSSEELQDLILNLKLVEEKQKILESRLKDVDECCGKLKGNINAEMRVVNERLVKIEQGMDVNCKEVEIQMRALQEQTKTQFNEIAEVKDDDKELGEKIDELDKKLDAKISKITGYYMKFTLGILISMAVGLIALLK